MNDFTFVHLSDVYEAERKALAKAATNGSTPAFMQGIVAMVSELEGQILDKEAENATD